MLISSYFFFINSVSVLDIERNGIQLFSRVVSGLVEIAKD